jgi:hypothetical protein
MRPLYEVGARPVPKGRFRLSALLTTAFAKFIEPIFVCIYLNAKTKILFPPNIKATQLM